MTAPRPKPARSTIQRRLRLARRAIRTIDGILAVQEALRAGEIELVADRSAKLDEAAVALAELLGYLIVRDRPKTRAPERGQST